MLYLSSTGRAVATHDRGFSRTALPRRPELLGNIQWSKTTGIPMNAAKSAMMPDGRCHKGLIATQTSFSQSIGALKIMGTGTFVTISAIRCPVSISLSQSIEVHFVTFTLGR